MENKKIGDLNKKTWYRFLKVVFIFALFITLLIFNGEAIMGVYDAIPQEKMALEAQRFIGPDATSESASDFFGTSTTVTVNQPYPAPLGSQSNPIKMTVAQYVAKYNQNPDGTSSTLQEQISADLTTGKLNRGTWAFASGMFYLLIGNLIILFIFEAMRRAFYYVTLGSLRPEK